MEHRDRAVGLERAQRILELARLVERGVDELLDRRLAERAELAADYEKLLTQFAPEYPPAQFGESEVARCRQHIAVVCLLEQRRGARLAFEIEQPA